MCGFYSPMQRRSACQCAPAATPLFALLEMIPMSANCAALRWAESAAEKKKKTLQTLINNDLNQESTGALSWFSLALHKRKVEKSGQKCFCIDESNKTQQSQLCSEGIFTFYMIYLGRSSAVYNYLRKLSNFLTWHISPSSLPASLISFFGKETMMTQPKVNTDTLLLPPIFI